nr:hypothetical protein [Lysinibacillus timonensis]
MRMPALPQSKEEVKKQKVSIWKSLRNSLVRKFSKKQKSFRIPPRD